jgi:hypothetical protein
MEEIWELYLELQAWEFCWRCHANPSLLQMRNTNVEDVTETKILEWKSVVQELMKEGFKLDFIFEHFPRFLETYSAKGLVLELQQKLHTES